MSAVLKAREPSARYPEAIQPALVRQFGLLTTAEGGVTRLRELILTLAVQGKLVPQCPGEAPASEILARARAAAAEQRRERRKSASSDIGPFEPDEGSPALPLGWEWCRGADLYTVVRGVTYQKADASDSPRDDYLPILRANNIRTTINFDGLVYVPGSLVSAEQLLRSGDFVVCLASGSKNLVGKAAVFTGEKVCSFGAFCGAIRLAVPLPFFSAFLASPLYREAVAEASSGIGINNLKSSTLLGLAIALPPEAEQARIVARVDELMRLCDALEAKGRLEAEQHARLIGSLLGTLTDCSTPEDLAANWQRIADHFDLLLDRPEAVDALEQTILQLAVRGRLVRQDPSEESATALMQRIAASKEHLISLGRIRRERASQPVASDSPLTDLPPGWVRVRLQEAYDVRDGTHDTPKYYDSGIPLVTSKNLSSGRLDLSDVKLISAADHAAISARSKVDRNDILFAMIGSIGNPVLVDTDVDFSIKNVALFKYYDLELSNPEFLLLSLTVAADAMKAKAAGGVQAFVSLGQIRSTVLATPPLAEQARIVFRVAELRQICADLRQRLITSQTTQSRLAEALVAEVT